MGLTYIEGIVKGPTGKSTGVTFLIDSGSGYCILPPEAWQAIELAPERRDTFVLADGTRIQRQVGGCELKLAGRKGPVMAVLGQAGDEAVVGAVALECLGLMLDPFRRKLRRMRMRL
jgi:predicted aspartyl protease